jgi:hypothetical protein
VPGVQRREERDVTIAKMHTKGTPPLTDPVAGAAIEARLQADNARRSADHEANRSADPARLVASDAGACARKIALGRLRVPKDITYDAAALMTFRAGDFYHQITQEAMTQALDMRCEVAFDLRPKLSLYGSADGVYEVDVTEGADVDNNIPTVIRRRVVEIKSQSGYGFDLATGAKRSDEGPGPKSDHLLQAGFAAVSPQIQADDVHVVYVNKDRGVVAEWIIGLDEELAHLGRETIRSLINAESKRLSLILHYLDQGFMPARLVPGYGLVDHEPPAAGTRGAKPWNCAYCPWQPSCAAWSPNQFPFSLDTSNYVVVGTAEGAA